MKIAVALSGGVDSTAAVILLRRAGHDVFGVTMRICPDLSAFAAERPERLQAPAPGHGCAHCQAPCACLDAEQVAREAGLRLEILDWRAEFEREVIAPFVDGYAAGQTPNPCALCNRQMKFGHLLEAARGLGAEAVATGHYAAAREGGIWRARDAQRDQTYFLSRVPAADLARVWFPLGGTLKSEAQALVADSGWHVRPPVTSTEICFLKDLELETFLRARRPEAFRPGEIVDASGRVLGTHRGLPAYTVGQRKGLGLAAPEPLYVLALDAETNRVVVGPDRALWGTTVELADLNWLAPAPDRDEDVLAQIRYRQPPAPARLQILPDARARLVFARPVRAITPGQVAACYRGERLLGGGRITAGS